MTLKIFHEFVIKVSTTAPITNQPFTIAVIIDFPKMKAPITLTIKTLIGRVLKSNGDSVILYLRKAPKTDPIAKNTNSKPFIFYPRLCLF